MTDDTRPLEPDLDEERHLDSEAPVPPVRRSGAYARLVEGRRSKIDDLERIAEEQQFLERPRSVWRTAWQRLRRRKTGMAGMIIIGFWVLVALFAPLIATHDPNQPLLGREDVQRRDPPCIHALGCDPDTPQHLLGLDENARDEFSRIVYGSRISLSIGVITVSAAILVGAAFGAVAGYWGGWLDNVIMRVMDVFLGFPALLLAIAIVAVLGPGLTNALLAIAIVTIPQYARVMRASVLQIKELDYVAASTALGAGKGRILLTRILPNALTPLVVLGTLGIAAAILEAAALSFLGLGAQPPTPEWGTMLGTSRNQIFNAPHLVFFPGLAIMLTVLGFNLLGDGLRDALDPKLNE